MNNIKNKAFIGTFLIAIGCARISTKEEREHTAKFNLNTFPELKKDLWKTNISENTK